jgi:flagellar operon protein
MADHLRIPETQIGPIGPTGVPAAKGRDAVEQGVFADLLRDAQSKAGDLKFSAHAMTRMQSRSIQAGQSEMTRLNEAVQKAAGKGAKESLVLLDDTAYVVSIPNKTVITVVDKERLKENVFTNIDSAVIA